MKPHCAATFLLEYMDYIPTFLRGSVAIVTVGLTDLLWLRHQLPIGSHMLPSILPASLECALIEDS